MRAGDHPCPAETHCTFVRCCWRHARGGRGFPRGGGPTPPPEKPVAGWGGWGGRWGGAGRKRAPQKRQKGPTQKRGRPKPAPPGKKGGGQKPPRAAPLSPR